MSVSYAILWYQIMIRTGINFLISISRSDIEFWYQVLISSSDFNFWCWCHNLSQYQNLMSSSDTNIWSQFLLSIFDINFCYQSLLWISDVISDLNFLCVCFIAVFGQTNEKFGEELEADLLEEGEKLGPVEKITVFAKNAKGPVVIKVRIFRTAVVWLVGWLVRWLIGWCAWYGRLVGMVGWLIVLLVQS